MREVLGMPAYLMEAVAAHARTQYPREVCGFLCGPKSKQPGVPTRFVPIPNVHAYPEQFFRMDDTAVINAFEVMDRLGEDPVAVYHSHPHTSARPSTTDLESVHDLKAIHIIVGLGQSPSQPTFQAWRIHEAFGITPRHAEEVAIDVIDVTHPESPIQGLVEGNRVRIAFHSGLAGSGQQRKIVGIVGPHVEESVTVYSEREINGTRKIVIPLERVVSVSILIEGAAAARTRAHAASFLAEAAMRLAATDTDGARAAIERATALMPRLLPRRIPSARGWRPVRASERRTLARFDPDQNPEQDESDDE